MGQFFYGCGLCGRRIKQGFKALLSGLVLILGMFLLLFLLGFFVLLRVW